MTVAVLLTGCMGGADDVTPAAAADAPADSPAPRASPDAASASSSPSAASPAASAPAAEGEEGAAAPEPVVVPVAFEGALAAYARPCVFAVAAGVCLTLPPHEPRASTTVDATGTVLASTLTLAWDAASAATEELALFFYSFKEGEFVDHAYAFGPSPLVVSTTGAFELREGWEHYVLVAPPSSGAFVAGVGAAVSVIPVEQPFLVEGTLTLQTPAPNP